MLINLFILFVAVASIILGCVIILAKEIIPKNYERKKWMRGEPSKWSNERERRDNILGILMLINGVMSFIWFLKSIAL